MGTKEKTKELSGLSKRFLMAIDMVGYTGYRLEKEIGIISQAIITHIRAGRNEPSMPVVIAFLKKFPAINGHWLLTGSGQPILESEADGKNDGSSYDKILHGIPVEKIIMYIQNNEVSRGFDENSIYNLFLEIRTQKKLLGKMKELEEKMNEILGNQEKK